MRPAGKWVIEKLDYLRRYIDTFETSMRDKYDVRFYIDLLAGPGLNRIRSTNQVVMGSPLIALRTRYPFTNYIFVDSDSENISALQSRCSEFNHSKLSIEFLHADCNQIIGDVISKIKPYGGHALNLAFLDPEGMELHWDTVAKIGSIKRMDLIINYPQGAISRNIRQLAKDHSSNALDLYFGTTEWRVIFEKWKDSERISGVHRDLINLYKEKLSQLGYIDIKLDKETGDKPLMRNAKRRAPMYRLLFASKHQLGYKFWQDITHHNVHGQISLF